MKATEFGLTSGGQSEHEALRYFRSLTEAEREEHLWMGLRELAVLGNGMIERQDHTNGTVAEVKVEAVQTKKELAVHLEMHKMEVAEISFVKRWGSRGTGGLAVLISLATIIVVLGDHIGWH